MRFLRPAPPVAVVAARLAASGHRVIVVDGRRVVDKASALAAIGDAGSFPDWVGSNLDALADALGDLSWLEAEEPVAIVWASAGRIDLVDERDRTGLLAVLADAERDDGPVASVTLLDGSAR